MQKNKVPASVVYAFLMMFIVYAIGGNLSIAVICAMVIMGSFYIEVLDTEYPQTYRPADLHVPERELDISHYINRLDTYIASFKRENISQQLSRVKEVSVKMLEDQHTSDSDKKILKDLKGFYFPSLCKIMDDYFVIQKNYPNSQKLEDFESEVDHFLHEFIISFEKQLEALLSDNLFDAKIEMKHVKNIMSISGFSGGGVLPEHAESEVPTEHADTEDSTDDDSTGLAANILSEHAEAEVPTEHANTEYSTDDDSTGLAANILSEHTEAEVPTEHTASDGASISISIRLGGRSDE